MATPQNPALAIILDLTVKGGKRAFNPATDSYPKTPTAYEVPIGFTIPDGTFAICVDPRISGSASITIEGDGCLVVI